MKTMGCIICLSIITIKWSLCISDPSSLTVTKTYFCLIRIIRITDGGVGEKLRVPRSPIPLTYISILMPMHLYYYNEEHKSSIVGVGDDMKEGKSRAR
jgi:hypothetical protein